MQKPIKHLKNKHLNDIKKRINTQKKPISYNTFNALMKELKHKLLKNLICDFWRNGHLLGSKPLQLLL